MWVGCRDSSPRFCGTCPRAPFLVSRAFVPACLPNATAPAFLLQVPPSMGHLKTLKEFNLRYNHLDDRYKAKVEEGLSK